jgi:hypothetical protein
MTKAGSVETKSTEAVASKPLVTFYRFIPQTPLPIRADRSAVGTLPTRAFRFCEAVTTASGLGYYLFPPMDFSMLWDGTRVFWRWQEVEEWVPLDRAQFPDFRQYFESHAPDESREFAPPFLTVFREPGIVQVWTGIFARTRPGVSLYLRSPINVPRQQHCEFFEGIIETDRWFGPVFTNLRITKTDVPVEFKAEEPILQAIPLPRDTYEDATFSNYELVSELGHLRPDEWSAFHHTVVRPNIQEHRPRGQYAAETRRRARKSKDKNAS